MMRSIVVAAFVSISVSAPAHARPYTDGWLTLNYGALNTNEVVYQAQGNKNTASVFTNAPSRSARRTLLSAGAASAVLLPELDQMLPTTSEERIRELARGLDHDWEKCFAFVRDNIAFSLYPGIMRGAERTLIDKEGNDADQSLLLVALLRASGYDASVIYEPLERDSDVIHKGFVVSADEACRWVGVSRNMSNLSETRRRLLGRLGMAGVDAVSYGSGDIAMPHYWVSVKIDGRTVYLDPSLKPCRKMTGRNVLSDMGYSRDEVLAAAGGTVSSEMSVRNLSKGGLESKLNALATRLHSVWTNANASAEFFTGNAKIEARTDDTCFPGGYFSDEPLDLLRQSSSYKNGLRTRVVLTCDGGAFFSFYLDEVGLRNLWLTTVDSGTGSAATSLHVDDASLATVNTSSGSSSTELVVDVQHCYRTTKPYHLDKGSANVYVLVVGFGGDVRNGMRRFASDELARLRANGLSAANPRMIAASLYVQGQQWQAQRSLARRLLNHVTDDNRELFYDVGIAGQSGSPFVDMGNSYGHSSKDPRLLGAASLFASALEHSVVEQLNGVASVSTVKLLNLANQNGTAVYLATSQNVETVLGQLSNYSEYKKAEIRADVASGLKFLLPQNGQLTLNNWTGTGYITHGVRGEAVTTGMIISGGLNGGYAADKVNPDAKKMIDSTFMTTTPNASLPAYKVADPVSMPSGAFTDSKTDLMLHRKNPLVWARSYDSRSVSSDMGLGKGWSHNYDASIVETTDADSVLGRSSVDAVIPTAVAMAVANDMLAEQDSLSAGENARRWMVAAMTIQWWTDYLKGSAVAVKVGARSYNFQRRVDGTYASSPGETAELVKSNGVYALKQRLGNTCWFNSDGKLQKIVDPSGNETRIVYENGKLTRIENDFDAGIDITWNDGRIAKVTDSAGRKVEYTYSVDCLTAVKDVRGKVWTMDYDSSCRLATKTDPDGQRLILNTYNAFGQVTNQVSDVGGIWKLGYASEAMAWNRDANGHRLTQYFDGEGRMVREINRDGTETGSEYDGHGHETRFIDEAGYARHFAYDENDNLVRARSGSGKALQEKRFGYDAQGRLVISIDALGNTNSFVYNSAHLLVRHTLADGSFLENSYLGNGCLSESRSYAADGTLLLRKTFACNGYGLPISQTVYGRGLPSEGITTSTVYSSLGLPTSRTDARGNVWTMAYDSAGELLSTTDPLGNTDRYTYTDSGYLRSTTDALNRTTTRRITSSGKIAATVYPDGTMATNRYDAMDNLIGRTDVRGASAAIFYNEVNQIVGTQTDSGTTSTVYDERGNAVETRDGAGVVAFASYDMLNRPTESRNALGARWTTSYDALNRPVSSVNPLGKKRTTEYDEMGRTTATFAPSGAMDAFGYDQDGNMTSYTNSENRVYGMGYDALGRIVAMTNALGVEVCRNAYDACGNLVYSADGNGAETTFTYDALNRLTAKTGNGFSSTFSYDAVGNMMAAEDGTGNETFAYDVCNQLVSATAAFGSVSFALAYGRDAGGLITNITYAAGKRVARGYDTDGRLVKVKDWLGHEWRFAYDGASKMTQAVSPNGITATYAYDAAGQLSGWRIGNVAGRSIERNLAGQRIADTVTAGAMPRIDEKGIRKNVFNAADQLVSSYSDKTGTTDCFSYDGNGAMVSAESGNRSITFGYNGEHQITAIGSGVATYECAYDALGNRIRSGGHLWIPDFTDGLKRPLMECAADGTVIRYYLWANSELLGFIDASGTLTIAHCDDFASVVALTDIGGNTLFTANYSPHGENWGTTGTNPVPFAWMGGFGVQKQDGGHLGDIYVTRHRLYSPRHSRFLSADPMGLAGGLNLYVYGNGDPLAYVDPLGLCADDEQKPFLSLTKRPANINPGNVRLTGREYFVDEMPPDHTYRKGDVIVFKETGERMVLQQDVKAGLGLARHMDNLANQGVISPYSAAEAEGNKIRIRDTQNYNQSVKIANAGTGMLNQIGSLNPVGFILGVIDVVKFNLYEKEIVRFETEELNPRSTLNIGKDGHLDVRY